MGVSNGTTIATFCVKKGYNRLSITSGAIRECYQEDACLGGTDPDRYCAAHHQGPCEYMSRLVPGAPLHATVRSFVRTLGHLCNANRHGHLTGH